MKYDEFLEAEKRAREILVETNENITETQKRLCAEGIKLSFAEIRKILEDSKREKQLFDVSNTSDVANLVNEINVKYFEEMKAIEDYGRIVFTEPTPEFYESFRRWAETKPKEEVIKNEKRIPSLDSFPKRKECSSGKK